MCNGVDDFQKEDNDLITSQFYRFRSMAVAYL